MNFQPDNVPSVTLHNYELNIVDIIRAIMAHNITGFHCWLLSGRELYVHISLGMEEGWITGLCALICAGKSQSFPCVYVKGVKCGITEASWISHILYVES